MRDFFARASKRSLKIGIVLGLIHFIISWFVIIGLGRNEPDAQWQLIWILFLPLDLPFSLLVFFSGSIFPDLSIQSLPYPLGEIHDFLLPAFIHGIIGPLWYFLFPVTVSSLRRRKHKELQTT